MTDPVVAPAPAAAPAPAPSAPTPVSAASTLMADPAAAAVTPPTPSAPVSSDTTPPGDAPTEPAAVKMPGKDATPEQWAEFYAQIGRPETPEAYELPIPDGDTGEFAKEIAPILHKNGITSEQAKGLAADWNAMVTKQSEAAAAADAAAATAKHNQNTAEAAALQTEWGQNHQANMELSRRAVQQFMPKDKAGETIAAIESVLGYKGTIQFLHGIGKGLGEGDAAGMGETTNGQPTKSLAERMWPTLPKN